MNENLTKEDLDFILTSLEYTKMNFENYQGYPSNEYKQMRINEVLEVMAKVRKLKKDWID